MCIRFARLDKLLLSQAIHYLEADWERLEEEFTWNHYFGGSCIVEELVQDQN